MSAILDPDQVDGALTRLRSRSGKAYWRGLDELFDQPAFRQRIAAEFPGLARMAGSLKRRDFLKCLGGALALAGLDGCERQPDENAYPYVRTPDGAVPGESRFYATAFEVDGVGQPVIGKCRDGRPIKLEGNPVHPASGGATDAFTQAALLGLYDPDRSAAPMQEGAPTTWDAFASMAQTQARRLDGDGGQGLRLLTGPVGSPTMARQIAAMLARWPHMRWHLHAPLGGHMKDATHGAFGRQLHRVLYLDEAETIVSLDYDVLGPGPLQTWHARGWAESRRAYQRGDGDAMLHVAEPSPSLTGVASGDRLAAAQGRIPALLAALATALGMEGTTAPPLNTREAAWVRASADALRRHPGRGLLTVGEHHPAELQQQAFAINERLGNLGRTLRFIEPVWANQPPASLRDLVRDMASGEVTTLFILDSNPAYSASPGLDFPRTLKRVPRRIHAGLHQDETAALCNWHVPLAHVLESWSDTRAADGSPSLIQPLVRPFLDVRSRHEVLALLGGESRDGRAIVRESWPGSDERWRDALVSGTIAGAAAEAAGLGAAKGAPPAPADSGDGLELIFRADPTIHDGVFSTNPWLQEMPKPLTKLTWDNAVHISPALADELGVANEDVVELSAGRRKLRGPVWIVPGQARRTVLVHLGYGRRAGGHVGEDCGFDAYALRPADSPWLARDVKLRATGETYRLASTQTHFAMDGEDFVRFVDNPGDALPETPEKANFYPPQERESPAWAMAIDLDLCIGCNACATACVAENNIAMVGKEQVAMGREMHWLRIDRYYEGEPEDPQHVFQPVPCMHCEDAPCEMGCPVNATVHSPDGLNLQVYNRCIGTRTCSAYCPYKVRRFNWLDYTRDDPPELKAARNPDVTVRDRGVMEKCTYCIQRIEDARITAKKEGRPIRDGEVKTACQQACPTDAIVFGDIARKDSEVSRRKADGRDYSLLEDANTRPRTTYGARIARGTRKA